MRHTKVGGLYTIEKACCSFSLDHASIMPPSSREGEVPRICIWKTQPATCFVVYYTVDCVACEISHKGESLFHCPLHNFVSLNPPLSMPPDVIILSYSLFLFVLVFIRILGCAGVAILNHPRMIFFGWACEDWLCRCHFRRRIHSTPIFYFFYLVSRTV